MKTEKLILTFLVIMFSASCSKQITGGYDKKQALEDYTVCSRLAEEWLEALDSTDYSHLLSLQSIRGVNESVIYPYINKVRIEYGKITGRQFLGSHIYFYSTRSLLTYVPEIGEKNLAHIHAQRSEDGFYIVQPKYFGLTSYRQMFTGLPEGDYVMLMFKVSPTNKPYAEERLTFVRLRSNNPDGNWQAVDYQIADEI